MRHLIWIGGIIGLTVILGCGSWRGGEKWPFEKKIDKLEEYHHKYGEIMVSRPIFAKEAGFFEFKLSLTARELYDDVGLQIAGRFGDFDVAGFRGALKLQAPDVAAQTVQPFGNQMAFAFAETLLSNASADPSPENSAIIADLLKASLSVAAPTTQPTVRPARQALDVPDLPTNEAAQKAKAFADAAKIFEGVDAGELKMRARDRATEAANAHYHIKMLELFSNPAHQHLNKGEKFAFLVGNITVAPGRITREGFIAEVTFRFTYADIYGRGTADAFDVVSVFPSSVGQNTSLQALAASQRDIALQFQAAGYVAAANALYEQSRINQSNVASVNQVVSLSSFIRGSGEQLGFRIRGEYAPVDLTNYDIRDGARPVVLLQDLNIPIVMAAKTSKTVAEAGLSVLYPDRRILRDDLKQIERDLDGVERTLTQTRLQVKQAKQDPRSLALLMGTSRALEQRQQELEEERLRLQEELKIYIRMDVETRWVPVRKHDARHVFWWHRELRVRDGLYRAKVADKLRTETRARLAELGISGQNPRPPVDKWREVQWLRTVPDFLLHGGLSGYIYQLNALEDPPSSKPNAPIVTGVYPTTLPSDRPKDAQFVFGGVLAETIKVVAGGKAALVKVDPRVVNQPLRPAKDVYVSAIGPGGVPASQPATTHKVTFKGAYDGPVPKTILTTTSQPSGQKKVTIEERHGGVRKNIFAPTTKPRKWHKP